MVYEFIEVRLVEGDEVYFKKRYRIKNDNDKTAFFELLEDKVGWSVKGFERDDNWWQ